MMKHIIFTCTLLLASAVTGEAMANCATNQGNGVNRFDYSEPIPFVPEAPVR